VKADFCVAVALLFFASIYMGTGFGLVALQFPGALENTKPDDFGTRFGSAVRLATIYFTVATTSMVVGGLWLAYRDWFSGGRALLPLIYAILAASSATFTTQVIFPVNRRLVAGIPDIAVFRSTLRTWMRYTVIRFFIRLGEWLVMAGWLIMLVLQ
jgi:hypothetical protein